MPRKKSIGTDDSSIEPRVIEEVTETGNLVTNEPVVEDYSIQMAIELLRRANLMLEGMNSANWQLNSTALKANLVGIVEYAEATLVQVRDAAE